MAVLFPAFCYAGNENYTTGSRTAALGGANITLCDVWSANLNQAGLAYLNQYSIGAFYENRFMLQQTGLKTIVGAVPTKAGVFGFSVVQFGYSAYSEGKYGLAYARKLGNDVSVGFQLNYVTARAGDIYGSNNNITAELGFRAKIIDNFYVAAHIYNLSHAKFDDFNNEYIPTILRAGLDYRFSKRALVIAEAVHDGRNPLQIKAGIEYNTQEKFYLRTGISTNPFSQAFGVGIKLHELHMDIGTAYHYVLGFSPNVSLWFVFGKAKEEEITQ
ncbi:MAG: hypothetical protein ACHQF2_12190 [Flavobacteriales bacterium]